MSTTTILYLTLGPLIAIDVALLVFFVTMFAAETLATLARLKYVVLMLKSLRRSPVRTALTYLATFVLVFVITITWSILSFLDDIQREKAKDFKTIITERDQVPSQMPFRYADQIRVEMARQPAGHAPTDDDQMTWQFVVATLDPQNRNFANTLFFFAMEPRKLVTMMDELDSLPKDQDAELRRLIAEMEKNKRGVLLGQERLKQLNKKVGETMQATCLNYTDLTFDFVILGVLPPGRYDQSSVMHREYLNNSLDDYERRTGKEHPLRDKTLNLIWLRVPDKEDFQAISEFFDKSSSFSAPRVKMETAASGISSWLEAYKDLIWGMRWLLSPAILATMSLVIANAISISVRERRTEMAVLKVLGFRPRQVMMLVLGETVLVGSLSGLLSTALTAVLFNVLMGGFKFPIAFFPAFFVPWAALWWGPSIGALTALAGTILPAWSARSVKVSEVFAKVA